MDTAARRASSIAAHGHVRKREGATVLQDATAIRRDKRYNGGHAVLDGHAADGYRNASRYRINVEHPVKTIAVDDGCAGSRAGDRQVVRDIQAVLLRNDRSRIPRSVQV